MNTPEQQLVILKQARSSGVLRVRDGDTDITYRSVEELNLAIASLTRELQRKNHSTPFSIHRVSVRKDV